MGCSEGLFDFCGLADFAPTGEVPCVRKAAALVGFDGLDLAILAVEKNAGAVGLIDQGKTTTVGAKAGVCSDELGLLHFQERGDGGDLFFGNFYVPRPAAAVGAAFAKIFGGFHLPERLRPQMGSGDRKRGGQLRGDSPQGEEFSKTI